MTDIEQIFRNNLRTDYLIGCYRLRDGKACFEDLRGCAGQRVQDFDGKAISSTRSFSPVKTLIPGEYYHFNWAVDGDDEEFEFISTGDIKALDKKSLLQVRFNNTINLPDDKRQSDNQIQSMINREVTGASHTYIYELLQNANDYPQHDRHGNKIPVSVNFTLSDNYLFFAHSGDVFRVPNIVAICTVNEGEKQAKTDTIGYKGMGFKSVFVNNDYAYLQSGGWSLRFDKKYVKSVNRFNMPWQYMPVHTEDGDLDAEVKENLTQLGDEMLVKFALRHATDAAENKPNLAKVFSDERILIFIPNVDEVRVYYDGAQQFHVIKDRNRWIIEHQDFAVTEEYKRILEESQENDKKIPEKFSKMESIRISFAVRKEGNKLIPLDDANVYNYLPTERSLYLPFLLNADFIPNASRSDLAQIKWNAAILYEAGKRYVRWWTSLLDPLQGYELNSVFSLLPTFGNDDYFRREFMDGFKDEIKTIPCIPIQEGEICRIVPLNEVIDDCRNFLSPDNPVMTDDEFYELSGLGDEGLFLPHPYVRDNQTLRNLLDYFKMDLGLVMTDSDYVRISDSEKFEKWITEDINHAVDYYRFLFQESLMQYQLDYNATIFVTEDYRVYENSEIYYNIDEDLKYLYMFQDLLPRLHHSVIQELDGEFSRFKKTFKPFSTVEIADDLTENFDEEGYADRILTKEDSIKFLQFLATAIESKKRFEGDIPSTLPIYLNDGKVHNGLGRVYVENELGKFLSRQEWLKENFVQFIDNSYLTEEVSGLTAFLEDYWVQPITSDIAWNNIILDETLLPSILEKIENKALNINFYEFLIHIEDAVRFDEKLKNVFKVFASDGYGNEAALPLSMQMYWDDTRRDEFLNESWLPKQCCWALDNLYLESSEYSKDIVKKFFTGKYIVNNFSIADFFNKCISSCWGDIVDNISSKKISIDFLYFLFTNRKEIGSSVKAERFNQIPMYLNEADDSSSISEWDGTNPIYQPSAEIDTLLQEPWFPIEDITVLDKDYADVFDSKDARDYFVSRGIEQFNLVSYVSDEIIPSLSSLKERLMDRDANISFHHFFKCLYRKLTQDDLEELGQASIFISSPENELGILSSDSTNHYLPTELLTEVISLDIIPLDLLDSIHPDYIHDNTDKEYFLALGNTELDNGNFLNYIQGKDDVINYIKEGEERNVRFWKWVADFGASFDEVKKLKGFPLLTSEDTFETDGSKLYLSDAYSDSKDMVALVGEFITNPSFVSESYLDDDAGGDWITIFKALGVNVTTQHIVINKVIPNLAKYRNREVVYRLASCFNQIDNWIESGNENRLKELENLYLYCQDGNYRKIKETLLSGAYVGLSDSKYQDVVLNNLVSEEYLDECGDMPHLQEKVRKLLVNLTRRFLRLRNDARVLRNSKIKAFLDEQQRYSNKEIHCRIVSELAEDFYNDHDDETFKSLFRGKIINLYDDGNNLISSVELYLGSEYQPECDFQAHGVKSLRYVSDDYIIYGNGRYLKKFFQLQLRIRDTFAENTLTALEYESFARYFWTEYLPSLKQQDSKQLPFSELLTQKRIGTLKCVPTKVGMRKPFDLYDCRDERLERLVKAIGKRETSMSDIEIPEGYYIGMKFRLDFVDCLAFLKKNISDNRGHVYQMMIDYARQRPADLKILKEKGYVKQFREEAEWYCGAKRWVPLKDLVALEWAEGHSLLKDNFEGNEIVISKMPSGKDDYYKLCDILDIRVIPADEFDICEEDGIIDTIASAEISKRLMYLAFKHYGDKWETAYDEIQKSFAEVKICKCRKINFFWSENDRLSTEIPSYIENLKELSYVGDWNGPMFGDVLEWLRRKFQFIKDFEPGAFKMCFLKDFVKLIQEREGGKLPESFLDKLSEYDRQKLSMDDDNLTVDYDDFKQIQDFQDTEDPLRSYTGQEAEAKEDTKNEHSVASAKENDNIKPKNSPVPSSGNRMRTDGRKDSAIEDPEQKAEKSNKTKKEGSPSQKETFSQIGNNAKNPKLQSSKRESSAIDDDDDKFRAEEHERWRSEAKKTISSPTSSQSPVKSAEDVFDPEETVATEAAYGIAFDPSAVNAKDGNQSKKQLDNKERDLKKADEERRELKNSIRRAELLEKLPRYSLEWLIVRHRLLVGNAKSTSSFQITLDFHDWCLIDSQNGIYRLVSPDGYIPTSFADYNNQQITIIFNGKSHHIDAQIIEVDETGIDLKCSVNIGAPCGGRHIQISATKDSGFIDHLNGRLYNLEETINLTTDLRTILPDSMSFVYGPPGTGKTHDLVNKISEIIRHNAKIKILVLTPTNRATDEIMERLCCDTFAKDCSYRYGVTESRVLAEKHYDKLRTRTSMDIRRNKCVVVTTIARYPYDTILEGQYSKPIFDQVWDYIIIDESSMIDVTEISLLLLNKKAKQYIIAGDPNQIRPITPVEIEDCNIYDMVNLNSFKRAKQGECKYPVKVLDIQYRSVPAIGEMVSKFCYDGFLKNDPNRVKQKPLNLNNITVDTINSIGFNVEMMSYLYGWNKVDVSPVHLYSAIFAYEFAGFIASQVDLNHSKYNYTIGIVTPYGKQKEAIKQLLEQRPVNKANCTVKCGTAHSFQGAECDIMIVVMNYPDIYAGNNAHINNRNIMNVAMSRARDYLFFLWPEVKSEHRRAGKDNSLPYIMNQTIGRLMPKGFVQHHAFDIEQEIFGDKTFIAKNSSSRCHMPVNVTAPTLKRYDIRLSDTALDIIINDDV